MAGNFGTIFVALLIVAVQVCLTTSMKFIAPTKCHNGFAHNAPRSRTRVQNRRGCEELCAKFENCKSYQVSAPRKKCQLLRRRAGPYAVKMTPRIGWAYREQVTSADDMSCNKFPYHTCSPDLISFGNRIEISRFSTYNSFMRESLHADGSYYAFNGYSNQRTLYEWTDVYALHADRRGSISLPFGCDGGQTVVRDHKVWCKKYNNRHIMVYDLIARETVAEITYFNSVVDNEGVSTYAGYSDQCAYDWGGRSDMDVMSDYGGMLYVIWGRHNRNCWLAASRINTETYEIEDTQYLNIDKRQFGTGFMLCGRLYFTRHVHDSPSGSFELIWDLRTGNYTHILNNYYDYHSYTRFDNRHNYNSFADFNPADGRLYKWENSRMISMIPRFRPRSDDFFADPYGLL